MSLAKLAEAVSNDLSFGPARDEFARRNIGKYIVENPRGPVNHINRGVSMAEKSIAWSMAPLGTVINWGE